MCSCLSCRKYDAHFIHSNFVIAASVAIKIMFLMIDLFSSHFLSLFLSVQLSDLSGRTKLGVNVV